MLLEDTIVNIEARPATERRRSQVQRAHVLPAQPTPLVGRAGEVELACRTLLRDEVRLLTFTGPAGAGKTRLALAVADGLLDIFTDGVFLVDLAPVSDPNLVSGAIADALGVSEGRDQPLLARLAGRLGDRRILLVLDNFEHVLAAAEHVSTLLGLCPTVKILVTSRAALRLRWEYVFPVGPLALPAPSTAADPAIAGQAPAVALFVSRARAANASFELTPENTAVVSELCARLDGLPLAIELAAARTRLLRPQALLARLRHRLDLLVEGASDLPVRQRTVRAAIGYSYDLLSAQEQTLFRQLAVFAGGCTPEAAAAVAGEIPVGGGTGLHLTTAEAGIYTPSLDGLASLVHKSLVQEEPNPNGEMRFRMLETVRAYAHEQLSLSGELPEVRQRALDYFITLAERARQGLRGRMQATWLEILDREHDNLRSLLRWCIESGDTERGLQLAGSLARFWELRGLFTEGRTWLLDLLALPPASPRTAVRARALSAAGNLAYGQGDDTTAEALQGESLTIRRELDDRAGIAASLSTLGLLAQRRNDLNRARVLFEESLAVKRELGDEWGIAEVLHELADLAAEQGQHPTARSRYEESLVQWQALGDAWGVAMSLESMGCLAQAQDDPARCLRLIGAATAVRERLQMSSGGPVQQLRVQRVRDAAETALGPTAVSFFEEGRAMDLDAAVLYARTAQEPVPPARPAPVAGAVSDGPLAWLTPREREVAALLLRGMSNRQIAEELVITERTAETHVCRILSKLGLGSRAQIAAWVMDRTTTDSRPRVAV